MTPKDFLKHPMKFPKPSVYRAFCLEVFDGDTIYAIVDLGLNEYVFRNIRFQGVDTSETFHPSSMQEREHGIKAKQLIEQKLLNKPIKLITNESTSFERVISRVYYYDVVSQLWLNIADDIISNKLTKQDYFEELKISQK